MSQSSARFADFVNLVERAIEVGRAAVPSRLHTDALVAWLGGDTSPRTTVALRVVDGVADFVPFAADAERVIVRTGADRVVDIDPDGLERVAQPGLWDDDRCRLVIPPGRLTAAAARRVDVASAVSRAAILRAADATGAAAAALDATVAHVTGRHQFGAPLGALQVVQHRCADMLIDVTIALDVVTDAAAQVDAGLSADDVALLAATVQATAVERCRRVTAAAHQLAGG